MITAPSVTAWCTPIKMTPLTLEACDLTQLADSHHRSGDLLRSASASPGSIWRTKKSLTRTWDIHAERALEMHRLPLRA